MPVITGTWTRRGQLTEGQWAVYMPVRVTGSSDGGIIPAGRYREGPLNLTEGAPSLQVEIPSSAGTVPSGWQPTLVVEFQGSRETETYVLDVSGTADIDLATITLPQDLSDPAPVIIRGVAGGFAGLDADGDVVNAAGTKVLPGGDGSSGGTGGAGGGMLVGNGAPAQQDRSIFIDGIKAYLDIDSFTIYRVRRITEYTLAAPSALTALEAGGEDAALFGTGAISTEIVDTLTTAQANGLVSGADSGNYVSFPLSQNGLDAMTAGLAASATYKTMYVAPVPSQQLSTQGPLVAAGCYAVFRNTGATDADDPVIPEGGIALTSTAVLLYLDCHVDIGAGVGPAVLAVQYRSGESLTSYYADTGQFQGIDTVDFATAQVIVDTYAGALTDLATITSWSVAIAYQRPTYDPSWSSLEMIGVRATWWRLSDTDPTPNIVFDTATTSGDIGTPIVLS